MELTRRQFGHVVAAGAVSAAAGSAAMIDSRVNGVIVGAQSYSFRDMDIDAAIAAMQKIGLGECELWSSHLQPADQRSDRAAQQKFNLSTPISFFEDVKKKFNDAGIEIYAYNYSFRDDFTDPEIERGFEVAKALGAKAITASANITTAQRVAPFAAKHHMRVGMHNHSRMDPNEFARPEDFAKANQAGVYIQTNLDIGHFVAAGFDPLDYIKKNHQYIVTMHIKDRKKSQGDNMPFGEGDTPIKEVLQYVKTNRLLIPANIEYEYGKPGMNTVAEVQKCFDYIKAALA